jgi:hypothetical protein
MSFTIHYTCTHKSLPSGPNKVITLTYTVVAGDPGFATIYPNGAPSGAETFTQNQTDNSYGTTVNLGDPLVMTIG